MNSAVARSSVAVDAVEAVRGYVAPAQHNGERADEQRVETPGLHTSASSGSRGRWWLGRGAGARRAGSQSAAHLAGAPFAARGHVLARADAAVERRSGPRSSCRPGRQISVGCRAHDARAVIAAHGARDRVQNRDRPAGHAPAALVGHARTRRGSHDAFTPQCTPAQGWFTHVPRVHDCPAGQSTPAQVPTQCPCSSTPPQSGQFTPSHGFSSHTPSKHSSLGAQRSGNPLQLSSTQFPLAGRARAAVCSSRRRTAARTRRPDASWAACFLCVGVAGDVETGVRNAEAGRRTELAERALELVVGAGARALAIRRREEQLAPARDAHLARLCRPWCRSRCPRSRNLGAGRSFWFRRRHPAAPYPGCTHSHAWDAQRPPRSQAVDGGVILRRSCHRSGVKAIALLGVLPVPPTTSARETQCTVPMPQVCQESSRPPDRPRRWRCCSCCPRGRNLRRSA